MNIMDKQNSNLINIRSMSIVAFLFCHVCLKTKFNFFREMSSERFYVGAFIQTLRLKTIKPLTFQRSLSAKAEIFAILCQFVLVQLFS